MENGIVSIGQMKYDSRRVGIARMRASVKNVTIILVHGHRGHVEMDNVRMINWNF
jgi:hypothetical protein